MSGPSLLCLWWRWSSWSSPWGRPWPGPRGRWTLTPPDPGRGSSKTGVFLYIQREGDRRWKVKHWNLKTAYLFRPFVLSSNLRDSHFFLSTVNDNCSDYHSCLVSKFSHSILIIQVQYMITINLTDSLITSSTWHTTTHHIPLVCYSYLGTSLGTYRDF